jgi:hypothetical protein
LTYVDPFGLFGARVDTDRLYNGPSISLKQTAERIGDGLGRLARVPGQVVEQIGKHAIPVPLVRDAVEASGVLLQGRSLRDYVPSYRREHSECLVTEGGKQEGTKYIGVACGINTTRAEFIQMMYNVADAYGGVQVYGLYCGTKGIFSDILEWGAQRVGVRTNQVAVAENYCRYMSGLMGGSGSLIQWNHSRGTETFFRGSYALDESSRQQLSVYNLGGAHITEKGHYGSIVNYIGSHDYVSLLGDPVWYSRAKYNPDKHDHVQFLATTTLPFMDHFWASKQYQTVLQVKGAEFIKELGKK